MKTEIQSIAVIGADSLGRGIAQAFLRAGYATILEDRSRSRLEAAVAWIWGAIDEGKPGGKHLEVLPTGAQQCCAPTMESCADLLRATSVIEDAVRDADLILEAAADELEVKLELFTLFDKFAKPGAILASTSASLSIADMASVTFCAERCIGLRFFDSGAIELVVTPETSAETIAACREVARRMGREVVVVADGESAKENDGESANKNDAVRRAAGV